MLAVATRARPVRMEAILFMLVFFCLVISRR